MAHPVSQSMGLIPPSCKHGGPLLEVVVNVSGFKLMEDKELAKINVKSTRDV